MNHELIAEYLASTKSPVQLVKHFDEVIDKNKEYPLIGQVKKDGIYTLAVVVDGCIKLYGRTGLKLYWEADERVARDVILHDGVYIAELCNPAMSLEQLSGFVNPNRKKEWTNLECFEMNSLCLYYHDYLTFDELLAGKSDVPYLIRYAKLQALLASAGQYMYLIENHFVYSAEEAEEFAESCIQKGDEGSVFKKADADWVAGHKGFRAMKIVRGVHLDLRCCGVLFGKGKRAGQIAALEFEFKGNKFKADLGKGWTDERRAVLTTAYQAGDKTKYYLGECTDGVYNEPYPIGKIWEVKALQVSSTGKALRLPKVVRVRWDKDEPDA